VQQPTIDYNIGHSVVKIAPRNIRFVRDFNAPPYQRRVATGEIPHGYHCVCEHYTINAYENLGYQLNPPRGQNTGTITKQHEPTRNTI
jgi:hypothetical protein